MRELLRHAIDPTRPLGAGVLAVVFLLCAIGAAQLVRMWGRRFRDRSSEMIDPTITSFIAQLMQLACFLVAVIIYAHLVPELQRLGEGLLASAGLVSLVIGLAAQNTLGNLVAGFALLLYRPFAIGDVLTLGTPIGTQTGTVKEFRLGHTKLMTEDGRWIIVPNSIIASNIIVKVK